MTCARIEANLSTKFYHHHLKIIGHPHQETKIVYADYSYKMHDDGLLYNTFRTATLHLFGHHIHLEHLTIENDAGCGLTIGQAVSLAIYGKHAFIKDCYIKGYQDTLFIGPLPEDLIQRYDGFLSNHQLTSPTFLS